MIDSAIVADWMDSQKSVAADFNKENEALKGDAGNADGADLSIRSRTTSVVSQF